MRPTQNDHMYIQHSKNVGTKRCPSFSSQRQTSAKCSDVGLGAHRELSEWGTASKLLISEQKEESPISWVSTSNMELVVGPGGAGGLFSHRFQP